MQHKLFKRADIYVFLSLLLLSAFFLLLFLPRGEASEAVVSYRGTVIDRIPLTAQTDEERTYSLKEGTVRVRFTGDGAEILSSDCTGKSCVHTGRLTERGASAVCLPLAFSVSLAGASDMDGITG